MWGAYTPSRSKSLTSLSGVGLVGRLVGVAGLVGAVVGVPVRARRTLCFGVRVACSGAPCARIFRFSAHQP